MLHRTLLITAFASLPWVVACTQSEDDACGEGTVYRDGGCHAASAGTSTGAAGKSSPNDGGSGPDAGGAPAGGAPAGGATDPNFGRACETADDCAGITDYCVPMSPFDSAYCSVQDCDASDPEACPAGWTCTDLSRFQAGAPWACTRPFD